MDRVNMRYIGASLLTIVLGLVLLPHSVLGQDDFEGAITADDSNNLQVLTMLDAHDSPIAEKGFNPTGTAFLTAGFDGKLCIWNVDHLGQRSGQRRFCLNNYNPGITLHAWSPDGNALAVYDDLKAEIAIYNIQRAYTEDKWETIEPRQTLAAGNLSLLDLRYTTDDEHLIFQDLDGMTNLVAIDSGDVLFEDYIVSIIADPANNERIFFVDEDGALLNVNIASGDITATFDLNIQNGVFSADGLWFTAWNDELTYVWQAERLNNERSRPLTLDRGSEHARFSPSGQVLATWIGETVTIWNLDTRETISELTNHRGGVRDVIFNRDGRRALSINAQGLGRFWQFDSENIPFLDQWIQGEIDNVFLGNDGITLILSREDFVARFYDFSRSQLRGDYPISTQAAISPDWTLVADSVGGLVIWHGLNSDNRVFDWQPIGTAAELVNVRSTPSQDLPRTTTIPSREAIFALGKDESGGWVFIQMPNGTRGWILRQNIINLNQVQFDELPIIVADE